MSARSCSRPKGWDIRLTRRLERVRAFSAAIDISELRNLLESMRGMDEHLRDLGVEDVKERLRHLSQIGPISLSTLGNFTAHQGAYELRVTSIMRTMVEPEPAPTRVREKRSRLLTQLKKQFRDERVLAQRGEDLTSHRIVPSVELDEGLVADLVLRNGAMHVVETVDASGEHESPRKALGDIGISALVLERARMKFGSQETKTRLVYDASNCPGTYCTSFSRSSSAPGFRADQLGERQ